MIAMLVPGIALSAAGSLLPGAARYEFNLPGVLGVVAMSMSGFLIGLAR